MTDYQPIDREREATRPRGTRTGVFLAIIALAFVAAAKGPGERDRHAAVARIMGVLLERLAIGHACDPARSDGRAEA